MESVLPSFLLEPNLLYLALVVASLSAVLALFVPGTGIIELLVAVGLLYGLIGLATIGAGWPVLLLLVAAFGLYALAVLGQFMAAREPARRPLLPVSPWVAALAAAAVQVAAGLLLTASLPGLAWWLVVALALGSLAVYRWMLLPTVNALRPPPQAGVEALIGAKAEVRTVPIAPGKPGMVYLNGELWQAAADEELAVGETVEVVAREGMRLTVRRAAPPGDDRS